MTENTTESKSQKSGIKRRGRKAKKKFDSNPALVPLIVKLTPTKLKGVKVPTSQSKLVVASSCSSPVGRPQGSAIVRVRRKIASSSVKQVTLCCTSTDLTSAQKEKPAVVDLTANSGISDERPNEGDSLSTTTVETYQGDGSFELPNLSFLVAKKGASEICGQDVEGTSFSKPRSIEERADSSETLVATTVKPCTRKRRRKSGMVGTKVSTNKELKVSISIGPKDPTMVKTSQEDAVTRTESRDEQLKGGSDSELEPPEERKDETDSTVVPTQSSNLPVSELTSQGAVMGSSSAVGPYQGDDSFEPPSLVASKGVSDVIGQEVDKTSFSKPRSPEESDISSKNLEPDVAAATVKPSTRKRRRRSGVVGTKASRRKKRRLTILSSHKDPVTVETSQEDAVAETESHDKHLKVDSKSEVETEKEKDETDSAIISQSSNVSELTKEAAVIIDSGGSSTHSPPLTTVAPETVQSIDGDDCIGDSETDYSLLEVEYHPLTPQQKKVRQLARQRQLNKMRAREAAQAREERFLRRQGVVKEKIESGRKVQWKDESDLVEMFFYSPARIVEDASESGIPT